MSPGSLINWQKCGVRLDDLLVELNDIEAAISIYLYRKSLTDYNKEIRLAKKNTLKGLCEQILETKNAAWRIFLLNWMIISRKT